MRIGNKIIFLWLVIVISIFGEDKFEIKQNNEELKLNYFPKKVATDSAILTRFFAALNIELVGVPNSTTEIPSVYNETLRIGKAGIPDLEKIKISGTDLIISSIYSKPTVKPKYDILNVPSFYLDVDTYENSKEVVKILGESFSKDEEAEKILKAWKEREMKIEKKLKGKKTKSVAVIYGNGESFFMTGGKHFLQGLMDRLGCENVVLSLDSSAKDKKSVPFSLEQLLSLNPEIILILPSSHTKNGEFFKETFEKNGVWKLMKAYKNDSIHILDPTLFRMSAGVNSIDALEELYEYVYEK